MGLHGHRKTCASSGRIRKLDAATGDREEYETNRAGASAKGGNSRHRPGTSPLTLRCCKSAADPCAGATGRSPHSCLLALSCCNRRVRNGARLGSRARGLTWGVIRFACQLYRPAVEATRRPFRLGLRPQTFAGLASFCRRRYPAYPRPAKPISINAHVEGSGTIVPSVPIVKPFALT